MAGCRFGCQPFRSTPPPNSTNGPPCHPRAGVGTPHRATAAGNPVGAQPSRTFRRAGTTRLATTCSRPFQQRSATGFLQQIWTRPATPCLHKPDLGPAPPEVTYPDRIFRIFMLRRPRLPLPPTEQVCRRRRVFDFLTPLATSLRPAEECRWQRWCVGKPWLVSRCTSVWPMISNCSKRCLRTVLWPHPKRAANKQIPATIDVSCMFQSSGCEQFFFGSMKKQTFAVEYHNQQY